MDNFLIWDGELNPTRIPRIEIDPEQFFATENNDQWIVVGKWRIKVSIAPKGKGYSLKGADGTESTVFGESMSGSIFVDQNFFTVEALGGSSKVLGRASGCFDLSW
ncbi:hypothetical protein [Hyphomonas sp.]|uniref:hypothetical protein n=1 Tax=Hyphomonas sp. TaxID=87 RepID=UPI000E02B076|nr:hypothetical protein [Hyphomonas sp.]RCL90153.1 MAG: hypothetical protein DBW63_00215 [Hyphomonas sp.]